MSLEYAFVFPLKNGLHARPAAVLRDAADRFRCHVSLYNGRNQHVANAKSALSLVAADFRLGDPSRLLVEGDDERVAMLFLEKFLREDFPCCDEPLPEVPLETGRVFVPRAIARSGAAVHFGTPVSRGLAFAPVVVAGTLTLPSGFAESAEDAAAESVALTRAVEAVAAELEGRLAGCTNKTEREVLKAHLAVAQDPECSEKARALICEEGRSAAAAVLTVMSGYAEMLLASESHYLRERALDIRDVGGRLLQKLCGEAVVPSGVTLEVPSVVAAEILTPSEFLALDRSLLRGLVLSEGGTTSHTVILARAFGVPCVTGVRDIHNAVTPGMPVIVDARRGLVIPEPPPAVRRYYDLEMHREALRHNRLAPFLAKPGATEDGRRIEVAANVSSAEEAEAAFARGAESIGLFRTEMLFLDRAVPPTEEEQYAEFRRAVVAAQGRPVIIRTLDIGGDKPLAYLYFPKEENPFLGNRAVRFYSSQTALIKAQFRAILRAAVGGNVKMLLPMISQLCEVRMMKELLAVVRAELVADGVPFNSEVELGVMLEVPSAVFAIEALAREAAFFSIGTNDLAQYFFAADRGNPAVAELANPLHPSFLRFLKKIVDDAHAVKRWVGMCGEMAGQEALAPLLLGLKLDEISMSSPTVLPMKAAVHALHSAECDALLAKALAAPDKATVNRLLDKVAGVETAAAGVLHADIVVLEAMAQTRGEAVKELVDRLWLAGRLGDGDLLEEAVWRGEDACPSGIGLGFAIPHCQSAEVKVGSIGVLRLQQPVEWQAADGRPVSIVLLLAAPEASSSPEHLQFAARLARKIMEEPFRDRLLREPNAEALTAYLREALEIS